MTTFPTSSSVRFKNHNDTLSLVKQIEHGRDYVNTNTIYVFLIEEFCKYDVAVLCKQMQVRKLNITSKLL